MTYEVVFSNSCFAPRARHRGSYKGTDGRISKIYGAPPKPSSDTAGGHKFSGVDAIDLFCDVVIGSYDEDEDSGGAKKKKKNVNQFMSDITTTRKARDLVPVIKNERGRGMRKVKR